MLGQTAMVTAESLQAPPLAVAQRRRREEAVPVAAGERLEGLEEVVFFGTFPQIFGKRGKVKYAA